MRTEGTKSFPTPFKTIHIRQWAGRLALSLSGVNWPLLLTGTALFGIFLTALATIQFGTPNLAGNDGYYHIKLAQIMREQGLRPPFPWLPLTILNPEAYYDHHFLYHVLLMPFTYGDLRSGAKWASIILPAFTFLASRFTCDSRPKKNSE